MKTVFILLLVVLFTTAFTSDEAGATWAFAITPTVPADKLEAGDELDLVFKAHLNKEWLLYSSDFRGDVGPQPTAIYFEPDDSFETVGEITPIAPKRKKNHLWETDISYFTQTAEFRQHIRLLKSEYHITGMIKGQLCSEKNGVCVSFERLFLF